MMKNKPWKAYVFWILFTEAVGAAASLLTREGSAIYSETVVKPLLSPPPPVFPIAWGILYALMGIGAAMIWLAPASADRSKSIALYLVQLLFNFVWSFIFFNFRAFNAAFFWLVILFVLVLLMTLSFRKVNRTAALLQIPYLLWLLFAGYLNLGVWLLNR